MIQKDYLLKNPMMTGAVLSDIKKVVNEHPHRDALITIYETGFPRHQIKALTGMIRSVCGGDIKIAGISLYVIADMMPMGHGVRLNLILTEETDIDIVGIACLPGEEDEAVRIMREALDKHTDARAVELFVSNIGLDATRFMEESMKGHEEVGVFGTMISHTTPKILSSQGYKHPISKLRADREAFGSGHFTAASLPVATKGGIITRELIENNHYIIAEDRFITDGFTAVVFSGESLNVQLNYALGWHPIGHEMEARLGERLDTGECTLAEIDGMKAVDLFHEYLGVRPDKYFSNNICEFPLIVHRNGADICLIPYDYDEDGKVFFNTSLKDGDKLRFSYASHDEVLGAAKESYESMDAFDPQALFLVMCGNRINFLRDDAKLEWEEYKLTGAEYALIHGISEIYYHHGRGGVLNSAHIAAGMREGERDDTREHVPGNIECSHHGGIIPLSERMSVFMSKMTRQLEEMAEEAEAANQAKSAFLSGMSHEIRTPINAVLGMDEMILRESNEADVIKYAEDIRSAGSSLLGIVNDILDFSKIEAGKLDILPVEYEFASVINDLYNLIKKRAEDKGLELKLDIDPTIPSVLYGDEIRVKQVITNILTNAVKYTEEGSVTLTVRRMDVSAHEESGGYNDRHGKACFRNPVKLYVSVKDTGIGIREEDVEKLFHAFERVDEERNRNIEGTGLGLNITSMLLELMDSRLEVESTYGKGSDFSFTVKQGISRDEPIGDISERFSSRSSSHETYRESFRADQAHILVVDDTRMNLDVVKNLLKKTRIGIDTAESGEEALRLVRENRYDMIFLDHRMPHMDGIECFRQMKVMEDNKNKDVPVVSLTANAVSGAREEYLTEGFADYLSKPIDSEKLEAMLIRYLPKEKVHIVTKRHPVKGTAEGADYAARPKPYIVMIDDETLMHDVAAKILGDAYRIETYATGREGLEALNEKRADLVLLDINMPDEDGFEVMKSLRGNAKTADIPVIFLTGDENRETEIEGFKAGAWDFVRKPFVAEVLLQRVRHTIELSRLQMDLTREVAVQTLRAEHLTQEVMLALSKAVDAKDHYTNGHSERVAGYATMLAYKMGMDDKAQAEIRAMGLLHDVGKIGVPREIINKKGRLTDEEFEKIKTHTTLGYDILKTITELPELATGARWHHERFNGSGYPDGKAGGDIPVAARIICVADSYDAMTSKRSYSDVRAQSEVRDELLRCSGTQFDPVIAGHMISLIDADTEYRMNEIGYSESSVAKYVEELTARMAMRGETAAYDTAHETGDEDDTEVCTDELPGDEEETVLPGWLAECEALDTASGVKNCGSVEGYLSVLRSFYSTIKEKADEIEQYLDDKDLENYTVKVHALKSSARIVGATELSEQARRLEEAGDAGDVAAIDEGTSGLLALYRSYVSALAPLDDDGMDLPDAPEEEVRDAYQALAEFIDAMDYELARMVLDSMSRYHLQREDKERFDRLRTRLSQLDWDGMRKVVEETL